MSSLAGSKSRTIFLNVNGRSASLWYTSIMSFQDLLRASKIDSPMHRRVLKYLRHFYYEDDMDFDEAAESAVGKRNLLLVNFAESCRKSYSPTSWSNEEEAEKKRLKPQCNTKQLAYEAKPNGLFTSAPEGKGSNIYNCFSITQLVGQKRQ